MKHIRLHRMSGSTRGKIDAIVAKHVARAKRRLPDLTAFWRQQRKVGAM